ncbi:unnamed protein product [Rangifer tarandus platyrhynchus]|uniref:Uncharacterized protein n=1 Tax=Rangifer tarandus platyrhynchus TaxID=3082113 RepID=A0AC60A5G9_RANTA
MERLIQDCVLSACEGGPVQTERAAGRSTNLGMQYVGNSPLCCGRVEQSLVTMIYNKNQDISSTTVPAGHYSQRGQYSTPTPSQK